MSAVEEGTGRAAGGCSNSTNQMDQLDEVRALESIYSGTRECFTYQISKDRQITGSITILLPKFEKEIIVYADLKAVHIHYLPPLLLHFSFPPDYPSCSMPHFSLHARWLDSTARHQLSKILNDSWTDYCGMPVLFAWIELLKEEASSIVMSKLAINLKEIVLDEEDASEPRNSVSDLLKIFIEYNEKATQKDFECEWYDCEVCFCSKSGKDCVKFMPCAHIFCLECVSEYCRQRLQDNLIRQFECLNEGCDSIATQTQIRQVLTEKEYEIYEQRLLEGTLDLMSDVVICPRISCQAPVIVDDGEGSSSSLATCSLCYYSFCTLCRKTYHGVEPCCLSIELREKLLDQFENATPAQREDIYKRFGGRKQFEHRLEALKSERWIESNSKACPSCHAKIEKNDGCNKMTCSKCGRHFCWLCGLILNKKDPYGHFNMPGSKRCFNRLFEGIIDEDEVQDGWFVGLSDDEGDD